MSSNNFGATGSNLTKLFHVTCREAGVRILVQRFGGLPRQFSAEGDNRFIVNVFRWVLGSFAQNIRRRSDASYLYFFVFSVFFL